MKLNIRSKIQITATLIVIISCLFYGLYIGGIIDFRIVSIGDLNPYGGWSALKAFFTDLSYRWKGFSRSIALTAGITAASFLMGRFFCGYICPIGAMQDFFKFAGNKLRLKEIKFSDKPELLKYLVLIIIIVLSILGMGNLISPLSPWLAYLNIFVGYQAEGTLGRRLLEGEKSVKLLGEDIAVNAEIYNIEGFSGHADKPALLNWIEGFKEKPGQVFVVHGERESKEAFAKAVRERFGIDTVIPRYNVVYDIKKKNHVDELVLETDKEEFTDKHIQELLKEVKELKKAFERALENTEEYLQLEDVNLEEIKRLNNNIKSLENEIMNLTMISAK
jgi:preprotein translocase subunit SecE